MSHQAICRLIISEHTFYAIFFPKSNWTRSGYLKNHRNRIWQALSMIACPDFRDPSEEGS